MIHLFLVTYIILDENLNAVGDLWFSLCSFLR